MTEKEVFMAACGVDEDGRANALARVETLFLSADGGEDRTDREITLDGPIVNIFRSLRTAMVDLRFDSGTGYDFVQTADLLQQFTSVENSMQEQAEEIPCVQLTILPREYAGEYYIVGAHGTWCLMPSTPGRAADTIRFIFDADLLHTYRVSGEAKEEG